MKTWFSWPGSQSMGGNAPKSRCTTIRSRQRGSRSRRLTSRPSWRSADLRVASPRREKLRRSLTIDAVRSAPRAMMPTSSSASPSSLAASGAVAAALVSRRRSGGMLLAMKLTGLLISCATPATGRPSVASFSDCTSCTWAFRSSALVSASSWLAASSCPVRSRTRCSRLAFNAASSSYEAAFWSAVAVACASARRNSASPAV